MNQQNIGTLKIIAVKPGSVESFLTRPNISSMQRLLVSTGCAMSGQGAQGFFKRRGRIDVMQNSGCPTENFGHDKMLVRK
jgi:hypothetical protein